MNKLKIKISPREFSDLLLLAQSIQEESWDKDTNKYKSNYDDSAEDACVNLNISTSWIWPLIILNENFWNEVQDWAREARELEEFEGVRIERIKEGESR